MAENPTPDPDDKPTSGISRASQSVGELLKFRDEYFLHNELELCVTNKTRDVERKLQETLSLLESIRRECEGEDKAQFWMLKGKALLVLADYSDEAFQLLSRAVKLRPQLTDGWNELGESYLRKSDVKSAINCFENTLKYDKNNKIALRQMSLALRQLNSHKDGGGGGGDQSDETNMDPQKRQENILKSIQIAKQAVNADVNDGHSWYILANAYLATFYSTGLREENLMRLARIAYEKARTSPVVASFPEYWYNFASVAQYCNSFEDQMNYLQKAAQLDPQWRDPAEKLEQLARYLGEVDEMIRRKASLKPKRIQSMVESLKSKSAQLEKSLSESGASFVYVTELTSLVEEKSKDESDPKDKDGDKSSALQKGVAFFGKVIGIIDAHSALPCHTYCLIDSEENCLACLIYNLASSRGPKIGDSLLVPSPIQLKRIQVSGITSKPTSGSEARRASQRDHSFLTIRVTNPLNILVNGQKIGTDQLAAPTIDSELRSDL